MIIEHFFRRLKYLLLENKDADLTWNLRCRILRGGFHPIAIIRYRKLLARNNSFIPIQASIEEKPTFPHGIQGIYISAGSQIGKNCTIFHQVTIGSNTLHDTKNPGSPTIGDNVYIGCGAKIIGRCRIGNNVRVGANCVVTEDIEDNCTVVLEKPRIIKHSAPMDNTFVPYTHI